MSSILVPCIKTQQSENNPIFSFVVDGKDIHKFANISRFPRNTETEVSSKVVSIPRPVADI